MSTEVSRTVVHPSYRSHALQSNNFFLQYDQTNPRSC